MPPGGIHDYYRFLGVPLVGNKGRWMTWPGDPYVTVAKYSRTIY